MEKLLEYQNLDEKKKYFQNGANKISINIDKVFNKLDKLHNDPNYVYRGCTDAKYKLYNSAQRHYINNELFEQANKNEVFVHYDNFIELLIEECKTWNNCTVKNLLLASGIDQDNSLAFLSYMQHFGVPTPFLDFTYNPYLALFFAVNDTHYIPSNNEIDNYFSIYYTYQDAIMFENWKKVFEKNSQNLNKGKINYNEVNKNSMHILLPDTEPYKILNNTNIINQEGLFFYNNHPFKPLEETYLEFSNYTKIILEIISLKK